VFHTEAIYDALTFERLIQFCREYDHLSHKRVICVIIPPSNPLIRQKVDELSGGEAEFIKRLMELKQHADIGYHGHFFLDVEAVEVPQSRMLCNNFLQAEFEKQVGRDLNWFVKNDLSHHGLYSAGWWFFHPTLARLLIQNDFHLDFSISPHPWLYNHFSRKLFKKYRIFPGEPFAFRTKKGRQILCIQNLIGCHESPFPQDFVRHVRKNLDPNHLHVTGVLHSHDYSLMKYYQHTMDCLRYLKNTGCVEFLGAQDFADRASKKVLDLEEME
jgi:hypothetical protein